ncbi:MAG: hypothetical protein M1824_004326 [Vezdaea acicularis]|nr:MAG: hypothetical protein M1824_004326 [Vezdaea acicularis]
MTGGPSIRRSATIAKSNDELTSSLRANFIAAQSERASVTNHVNGHVKQKKPIYRPEEWIGVEKNTLWIPKVDWTTPTGLEEERSEYDITLKLFYLPGISSQKRWQHADAAVRLVLKELGVNSVDLLILSFPGVSFDSSKEASEALPNGTNGTANGIHEVMDDMDSIVHTWKHLEKLHDESIVNNLGVSEFSSERLRRFLPLTRIKPSVDQVNLKDACQVPGPLIRFAKQEGIEVLAHNDCTNILPKGTTRELLGPGPQGVGVFSANCEEAEEYQGLWPAVDIQPQWVVKYTAVVRNRGIVENKGYFAAAAVKGLPEEDTSVDADGGCC